MPNMSYCRFQNTLGDLQDCLDHINDKVGPEERSVRQQLVDLCREILEEYEG